MRKAEAAKLVKGQLVEVEVDGGEWVTERVVALHDFPMDNEVGVIVEGRKGTFPHTKVRLPK